MRTKENKKGISLIVLIITIIVVIILAAVVILTISKNNPIESAKEARFKEDVRTFQDELALAVSKEYADAGGHRDEKITTSDFDEIKGYIPSFSKKYDGMFMIKDDELLVISNDELKKIQFMKNNLSEEIKFFISNGIDINFKDINFDLDKKFSKIKNLEYRINNANYICSSEYSSGYDASKAFDNNKSSYWCSLSGQSNNAFIGYKFDKDINIFGVSILCQPSYLCKEVKLQCSNDNITWLDASDIVILKSKGDLIVNTKQKSAFKYWRIYIVSSFTSYATAEDIKFYTLENAEKTDYPVIKNISDDVIKVLINSNAKLDIDDVITYNFKQKLNNANDKVKNYLLENNIIEKFKNKRIGLVTNLTSSEKCISSSIYSGEFDAYMAFDNYVYTYWCTEAYKQDDAYIGYKFDKETYVNCVDVLSYDYRPKQVKLQCSEDNTNWIDASNVVTLEDNNNIHTIESNIKDKAYKCWRLYIVSGYRTDYTGIHELNFMEYDVK